GLLSLVGITALRYNSRLVSGLRWRWKVMWHRELPPKSTRVLIVGAGESGQEFAWRFKHRVGDNSYKIVGFVDDDPQKQEMYVEGCPVLGTRRDMARIVEHNAIDLIVVAIHNITGADF